MKVPFNKSFTTAPVATLIDGRHIGTVIQIVGIGNQPAFETGNPPEPSIGVVVQFAGIQLTKKMRLITNPYSKLFEYLHATLPDPNGYDGDNPIPLTLGRHVACEVTVKGQYNNIASFHRPESFEISDAPQVAPTDLVLLESPDALTGDNAKDLFMKLHRDIRSWISKRVKERS